METMGLKTNCKATSGGQQITLAGSRSVPPYIDQLNFRRSACYNVNSPLILQEALLQPIAHLLTVGYKSYADP